MADQKKRTAPSVQDVINGGSRSGHSKFKSGYTGPKKPAASISGHTGTIPPSSAAPASVASFHRSGGILDYAWIAYVVVLLIGLSTAIIAYGKGGRGGNSIYYPHDVFTVSGVVKDIFADYKNGGLGSGYSHQGAASTASSPAGTEAGTQALSSDGTGASDGTGDDNSMLLGESATVTPPNSTTGATMALDTGGTYGTYSTATSHEDLLMQLDTALSSGDAGFVGMKLAYEDEETRTLIGYPESVVEHFTKYMSENPDKRETFLSEIKDPATYSAKNGSAYLVKLPLLQFTINMGYDGTTISISGFSDQKMDSGQTAIVSPLLPCMYTIHAETAKGSQTSEVECNMNEGNLKINIGVTN